LVVGHILCQNSRRDEQDEAQEAYGGSHSEGLVCESNVGSEVGRYARRPRSAATLGAVIAAKRRLAVLSTCLGLVVANRARVRNAGPWADDGEGGWEGMKRVTE